MSLEFDISADLSTLQKGLSKAQGDLDKFAKNGSKKLEKFSKSATNVGKQLSVGLTAPIALLGGQSVRTFAKFDDQMRKVGAIAGATSGELESLTDVAKNLGSTTAFTAKQAAQGLEFMALAGFNTQESIKAIPQVLNLASAAAIDLGQASDIVTDNLSAFNIEAKNAQRVTDVLAKTQSIANTSVQQIGEAFKLVSANANSFGIEVETASAILGAFGDAGIKGSRAGTTFDAVLRDLKDSADNGVVSINNQNIALADAQGNFRNILDIVSDVQSATSGLTEIQRNNALSSIFQARSIRGVNVILGKGVDATKNYEKQLKNAGGTAEDIAGKIESGLGGSLRKLNSAFQGFAISLGETLAPTVNKLAGFLSELLNKFQALSPATKKVITVVAGLAAAAGPLLIALGAIGSALPLVVSGFAALTGPIAAITASILGVGGLVFGITQLSDSFDVAAVKQKSLQKAQESALQATVNERQEINKLVKIAKSEKVSREKRIEAVKELQTISKKFNGVLKDEKINTEKLTEASENYIDSLLKQAKVKAAKSQIEKLSKELFKLQSGTKTVGTSMFENLAFAAKNSLFFWRSTEDQILNTALDIGKEASENQDTAIAKTKAKIESLKKYISSQGNILAGLFGDNNNNNTNDVVNNAIPQRQQISSVTSDTGLQSQGANVNNIIQSKLAGNVDFSKLDEAKNRLNEFAENSRNIIQNNIGSAFGQIGQLIGKGLAGGAVKLEQFGGIILGTIGNIMVQLGKQALVLGKAIEGIKAALQGLNGFAAIAAGTALIAVGSAFKSKAKSLGNSIGSGGSGIASGGGQSGDRQTAVTSQNFQNNEVVFKIKGRDLVGVLDRNSDVAQIIG